MKRVILCALVVTAGIGVAGSASADGYDDTGAWYFSPLAQYDFLGKSRIANNHAGYQLGVGYDFAPNFAAEVNVSNGTFRIPTLTVNEKLTAWSLDVLYKFLPVTAPIRPYVLLGSGAMTDIVGPSSTHVWNWEAEAGVGALTALGSQSGSTRFQLRTEVKYRREFIQNTAFIPNNPGDIIAGVGFVWMFGAKTPPLPPVVQAIAPPAPEPAPAPPPPPPAPVCVAPAGFQVDANCRIIEQTLVVRAVDFEFNSGELTLPARQTLDEVAASLVKQPELQVQIQGYTDSTGSAEYNLRLSQKRAESVRTYLIGKDVSAQALTAKGFGKADPIATNATTEGRAQNRRVAFQVANTPDHVKVVTEEASSASTEAAKQGEPERAKKAHKQD
jgi:OmpA-OmpF porin, OOP family